MKFILILILLVASVVGVPQQRSVEEEAKRVLRKHFHSEWPVDVEATSTATKDDFELFKFKFNKVYDAREETSRELTFKVNMLVAAALQHMDQGTAEFGETQFSDMTLEEFRLKHSGLKKTDEPAKPTLNDPSYFQPLATNWTVDWRTKGVVTPPLNEGQCGSCWAFSAVEVIESQWAIKKQLKAVPLSVQELMDCDTVDQGCEGGFMTTAYKQIEKLGGLETAKDYPYDVKNPSVNKCKFDASKIAAYINDTVNLPVDETFLANYVKKHGPIATAYNAQYNVFYKKGVMHPSKAQCEPGQVDHSALIVGFGQTDTGVPFWIVKEDWGVNFGEKGYVRIYRGDGTCGIGADSSNVVIY